MTIKSFALCDLREDSRASLRNSVALRTIDDDWKALGSSRVPRTPRGLRGVRPKRMRLLRDPAKSRPAAARKRTGDGQNCKSGATHRSIVFAAAIRPCTYKPAMSG